LWKVDLSLDVGFGGGFGFYVAPVRRRENAKGDRNTSVKVQIDDVSVRETFFSKTFQTGRKEDKKGSLASLG